jgi:opacity protein-like surface antigen
MKRFVLMLVALVSFASLSHAQRFTVGGAIGLTNGPQAQFSVFVGANDLVKILFVGADARLEGNLTLGNNVLVSIGGAFLGTLNLGVATVYAGPQLNYAFTNSAFSFGAVGGVRYNLILGLSAFLEGGVLFTDPLGWRVRAGASFSF